MQDLFAEAFGHHQAGHLDAAERLYRQLLAIDPCHADGLHLLGVVAYQTGRHDLAVALIGEAIDVNPGASGYHSNLGNALMELGRLDRAAGCFRTSLALDPDSLEAQVNLGNVLLEQGHPDAATGCFRRALALRPDLVEAHNNLGNALRRQGRLDEAVACCREAIALKPDYLEAHVNLGSALLEQGRLDEAVACCRDALRINPGSLEAHVNLGSALMEQGRLEEAVGCFRRALDIRPDHPDAHNNLGNALMEQGRLDEAVACFRRALALKPDYPDAHVNLGTALRHQGWLDEGVACFRKALDLKPDLAGAHSNLGAVLRAQGDLDQAVVCFRKALDLKPEFAPAHANLAMGLLAQGEMTEGWEEYEWRWQTPHMIKGHRDVLQPQWNGEAAAGRVLLIHAEQGFGDTLQFCRYATLAAARGLRVVLEVQPPLVRLLRSIAGVERVMARGEALPAFNLHCPMLSLPRALGTTLATIPAPASYLQAHPMGVAAWRARLAAMAKPGLRVGLVWAGNSHANLPLAALVDRRRSIAPSRLAPLFELPEVHFFGLQKDGPAAPEAFALTDLMSGMADFADTAALVATLDLVISVDSAMAHLAAALGKPVWMLDRFDPCWRWLTGRRDSPWYPTLRLYRQPQPGDWDAVLADVAHDLKRLVGETANA